MNEKLYYYKLNGQQLKHVVFHPFSSLLLLYFYRYLMNLEQRALFRQIVHYFNKNLNYLGRDLTFLLGFYVSIVAKRWWDQYRFLPWPDNLAMNLTGELS